MVRLMCSDVSERWKYNGCGDCNGEEMVIVVLMKVVTATAVLVIVVMMEVVRVQNGSCNDVSKCKYFAYL